MRNLIFLEWEYENVQRILLEMLMQFYQIF